MGFDADWQLAGCMKRGMSGSGYPAGWLSERRPCPHCQKAVAGRHVGMADHIKARHSLRRSEAMAMAVSVWSCAASPAAMAAPVTPALAIDGAGLGEGG